MTDLAAPTARAPRATEFVDIALQLIQTKGYERMSIQDVLDGAQASRGAFYHYFDSKQALLEAVIDRMTAAALASVADILDDPKLPAAAKLRGFFSGVGTWKNQRSDLILGLIDVWLSDDNAVVREKLRATMVVRLGPVFARILAQGKDEGAFAIDDPDAAARVLVSLLQAAQETATELFVARQAKTVTFERVEAVLGAYFAALERIVGVAPGSLTTPELSAILRQWYG